MDLNIEYGNKYIKGAYVLSKLKPFCSAEVESTFWFSNLFLSYKDGTVSCPCYKAVIDLWSNQTKITGSYNCEKLMTNLPMNAVCL